MIRSWVCHNHKVYYTYAIGCAFLMYQFWWYTLVGYYRQRNYHRSLPYAQMKEKEWELNKPKEEEYDDEEDESEEEGEAPAGGDAGGDEEEE